MLICSYFVVHMNFIYIRLPPPTKKKDLGSELLWLIILQLYLKHDEIILAVLLNSQCYTNSAIYNGRLPEGPLRDSYKNEFLQNVCTLSFSHFSLNMLS